MLYTLRFFSSKCSLFHNANLFGSCITFLLYYISYTGVLKLKKNKFRRQRVNLLFLSTWRSPVVPKHIVDMILNKWIVVFGWIYCESYLLLGFHNRGGERLLRGANWNFKHNTGSSLSSKRHVMFQTVSRRRFLVFEARVRSLASKCEICGRKEALIHVFSLRTLDFICHSFIHSSVFSLRGRVGRNQSPFMWTVWLWHTASRASPWGRFAVAFLRL